MTYDIPIRITVRLVVYDVDKDEYRCPNNKALKVRARKVVNNGVIYKRYIAKKKDCSSCEMKFKCIRSVKGNKGRALSVPIGYTSDNLSKAMADKIDTEEGRRIYGHRIAIVEPVFANITSNKRMNRLTLRGKTKVNIQWMLYCMVHNIGKIMAYGYT